MRQPSRRRFLQGGLALAGVTLLAGCGVSLPGRGGANVSRIGFLLDAAPPLGLQHRAFLTGLRDLGYVEGQNLAVEYRWSDNQPERLAGLASELVNAGVDVIVASGGPAARAAMGVTSATPIVFGAANDPIEAGLVGSLARPGGNVTGLSLSSPTLNAKRLELLKLTLPSLRQLAVLWYANGPMVSSEWLETQVAGRALALELRPHQVSRSEELDGAFSSMAAEGSQALLQLGAAFFSGQAPRLVALAARYQLPTMYPDRRFIEAGGLMSYGPSVVDAFRRAAVFVDRILKGAKPADLPVEQPTVFDFVVNLKTAAAINLAMPSSVLQQATDLIQ